MATKTKKNHRNVVSVGECVSWENKDWGWDHHDYVGVIAAVNGNIVRVRGVLENTYDRAEKLQDIVFSLHNVTIKVISKKEYADF